MNIKIFDNGITVNLLENVVIELWIKFWNPLEYIAIRKSFELKFKGDHAPFFNFFFAFIFFSIDLELYDNRHENEKEKF